MPGWGRYSDFMVDDRTEPEAHQGGRPFPWIRVAYGVSAGWMLLVLGVTNADPDHPLFKYIFNVPLAAWLGGAVIAWIVRTWRNR